MNSDLEFMEKVNQTYKIGQILPSRSSMIKNLGLKFAKGGRNISLQDAELKRFFNWENIEGSYRVMIIEIYDEPKDKVETRGAKGSDYIKTIRQILLMRTALNGGKLEVSRTSLLKLCKMINDNYYYGSKNVFKISKFHNIDINNVQEFFEITTDQFKNDLNRALNSLHEDSLLEWSLVKKVRPIEVKSELSRNQTIDIFGDKTTNIKSNVEHIELNDRLATETERKFIGFYERQVMLDMGFRNKQSIRRKNKWEEYQSRVDDIILKELGISFYYNAYQINCYHIEHVIQEIQELEKELNVGVIQYFLSNAHKRRGKAINDRTKGLGKHKQDEKTMRIITRAERRANEEYIPEQEKLAEIYLNMNYPSIESDVKAFVYNYLKSLNPSS